MHTRPNIKIPQGDQADLERLITREYNSYSVLLGDPDDTAGEADQCLSNVNQLLDHWPEGINRPLAAKTGRLALEQLDEVEV